MKNKNLVILALMGILTGAVGISTGMIGIILISDQDTQNDSILNMYFCETFEDIEEAISDIGTDSGEIYIISDLTLNSTIDISGGGIYKIQGLGDVTIYCEDGLSAFDISAASYCSIDNIELDITEYTSDQTNTINIHEINNKPIILSNIHIKGDFDYNGIGINVNSSEVWISDCSFNGLWSGMIIQEMANSIHVYDNSFYNNYQRAILCQGDKNVIQNNIFANCYYDFIYIEGNENKISNNYLKNHSRWGITVEGTNFGGSKNTISCNTILGLTTSDITPTGVLMYHFSVDNLIIGNIIHGFQITSGGTGTGITILSTSQNTSIIANSIYGNDINLNDLGINTFLEANNFNEEKDVFYCNSGFELQDALDNIGNGSGEIVITENFALSSTIQIDGGGDYIIRSTGQHIIDCGGDREAFYISSAKSCVILDLKIDASDLHFQNYALGIFEENNNSVILENLDVYGDSEYNIYGIYIYSHNVKVINCRFSTLYRGLRVMKNSKNILLQANHFFNLVQSGLIMDGTNCIVDSNHFYDFWGTSTNQVYFSGNHSVFSNNVMEVSIGVGLNLNGGSNGGFNLISGNVISGIARDDTENLQGMLCINDADNNTITSNLITNFINIGSGWGYGIYISSGCDYNTFTSNTIIDNDSNIVDIGSNNFFDANNAP